MREIKFRVWDRKKKQFDTCRNGGRGVVCSLDCKGVHEVQQQSFKLVSQYTGLKDKFDVEIYEGDVGLLDEEIGEVYWDDGCFYFRHGGVAEQLSEVYKDIDFQGNIWENPELLN